MTNVDASPATRKLYECMLLVEACGASAELTAAINALGELDAILHGDAATSIAQLKAWEAVRAQLDCSVKERADNLVALTRWMAENSYSADEVAYAVEKPWKYLDELTEAKK